MPCAEHVGAPLSHTRNSNADLINLIVSRITLQYNPFILVEDFAKPQICKLNGDESADVMYIHIMLEKRLCRIEYATDARGSCEATGVGGVVRRAARGAGGVASWCGARAWGRRRRLNRASLASKHWRAALNCATSARACVLAPPHVPDAAQKNPKLFTRAFTYARKYPDQNSFYAAPMFCSIAIICRRPAHRLIRRG